VIKTQDLLEPTDHREQKPYQKKHDFELFLRVNDNHGTYFIGNSQQAVHFNLYG